MFKTKVRDKDRSLPEVTYPDAAYAYDAAMTTFSALWELKVGTDQRNYEVFSNELTNSAKSVLLDGLSVSRIYYLYKS